jgi:hypothetical protein
MFEDDFDNIDKELSMMEMEQEYEQDTLNFSNMPDEDLLDELKHDESMLL